MLGSDIGGVVSGLINNSRGIPSMDLSALFDTIKQSGARERDLINALPENIKPLYDQYKTGLGQAGTNLQSSTDTIGKNLMDQTTELYGPNSPAVQATLAALKQQDYSTLPGTLTNLKANLAASGGLERGGAGKAITQAVLAPAATYSQQAATVTGQQLQQQQQATQQAINKIAAMDDATAQSLFGMSKEQATTILTSGRQDLQQQLTGLINQSTNETNQMLGVEGMKAQNEYDRALENRKQQAALTNGLVNLGVNGISSFATSGMGGGAGAGAGGADVGAMNSAGSTLLPPALSLMGG